VAEKQEKIGDVADMDMIHMMSWGKVIDFSA
jgi:hypothetical protein